MSFAAFHRFIDRLAMWSEDRIHREPQPYRPADRAPLRCFGPLPELPEGPVAPGRWSVPSPLVPGDRMGLTWIRAHGRSRGTTLLVPPWKTRSPGLVEGYSGLAARAGYDVWLITPPHHLERTTPGRRSGEEFVSLDLVRFRSVFEQLVLELRISAALAARRGGEVGIVGLSLGALAAAFAVTAEDGIGFAALVAPPADLADVMCGTQIGRRYRDLARRAGAPLPEAAQLRELLDFADPRRRRPRTRRLFLAAGLHDVIAPARGALGLARAWEVTPRLYRRGHMTLLFGCRALRRDLLRFIQDRAHEGMRSAAGAGPR